jgi:hypothetical protein
VFVLQTVSLPARAVVDLVTLPREAVAARVAEGSALLR